MKGKQSKYLFFLARQGLTLFLRISIHNEK